MICIAVSIVVNKQCNLLPFISIICHIYYKIWSVLTRLDRKFTHELYITAHLPFIPSVAK